MFGRSKPAVDQKSLIKNFRQITNATEKAAETYLKRANWEFEVAVDEFYTTGGALGGAGASSSAAPAASRSAATAVFEKYKAIGIQEGGEEGIDAVQMPAFPQLAEDLGISLEDPEILMVVWSMKAKKPGIVARDEFIEGLVSLGCDSIDKLKAKLPSIKQRLDSNPADFKSFYSFVFDYSRQQEAAKTLPVDMATALWGILLNGKYGRLDLWNEYIMEVHRKAISKDTWIQFLDFTRSVKEDMSNFDDSSAWPVVIDDFVAYAKSK